jgi:hypothetical protein
MNKVWRAVPSQIHDDLTHLATIMHADAWGALGGEPTLHPQLSEICRIARASGIADKIEVWTNGINIAKGRMPKDFWSSFDVLVLSIYEGRHDDRSLDTIRELCAVANVQLVEKDERTWHNFRTNLEPAPTPPDVTKRKYDGCFFRQFSRVANRGYFYTCCCAPHQPVLLQGRPHGSDGIPIAGLTERALRAYLTREEPLGCCTICAGRDTAKAIEWGEERDPERWVRKSAGLEP